MQLEEADYGLTHSAMGQGGGQPGDETLLVRFYRQPMQNMARSETEGRPIYEDVDMVEIRVPGNKLMVIAEKATQAHKNRFPEHWKRYSARESQEDISGTLLEEWPAITRSQVEELRFFHVRTVEQLVTLSDAHSGKIMGIQDLKRRGAAYLEHSKTQSEANALSETKRQLDEQQALNATLSSRLEALESLLSKNVDEPKRRGRPPKDDSERTT